MSSPARSWGHVHSWARALGIWGLCPVAEDRAGYVRSWPAIFGASLPGPPLPAGARGHVQSSVRPGTCPFLGLGTWAVGLDMSLLRSDPWGHVQSWARQSGQSDYVQCLRASGGHVRRSCPPGTPWRPILRPHLSSRPRRSPRSRRRSCSRSRPSPRGRTRRRRTPALVPLRARTAAMILPWPVWESSRPSPTTTAAAAGEVVRRSPAGPAHSRRRRPVLPRSGPTCRRKIRRQPRSGPTVRGSRPCSRRNVTGLLLKTAG